jgi:DNA-binding XRE family transcriptional regulator
MQIDIKISDKFSPTDAEAFNSVIRLLFNISETKIIAKITTMMKQGWTTLSLTEKVKGEKTNLCLCPGKVINILTDWYFIYLGDDKYQFQTQETRRRILATLGRSLKSVRIEQGVTQSQLGAQLGVTRAYISSVEFGRKSLSLNQIERIARVLGVEVSIVIRPAKRTDG